MPVLTNDADGGATSTAIRGARVIDGTGRDGFIGDIVITGDRISVVGDAGEVEAERTIDAEGRVVCPGFIDLHSHVDLVVDRFPRADGMLRQGATTLVTGNCGLSPFPVLDETGHATLDDFVRATETLPLGVNIAPLIGHGAVRAAAMEDPSRVAGRGDIERMRKYVADAMGQGAFGMSTGLIYDPGRFSGTEELIALATEVEDFGGFYASHIRGEDDRLVGAVDEALRIGREAGVAVQLSHHKAKRRRNWGSVQQTLAMVDDAAAAGVDVSLDAYPYTASSTGLWAYLPDWARRDELLPLREDFPHELRERVLAGIQERFPGSGQLPQVQTDLSDLTISQVQTPCAYSRYEGMGLHDAVQHAGVSQAEFVLDALLAGSAVQIIDHAMSADDMHRVFAHPRCGVGSDARPVHVDLPGVPHPRNFGTYPRFLREIGPSLRSLEEAIHKCTGLPARRLGDQFRRGVLRPGFAADLLMFDPDNFRDNSTFADPKHYATGLDLVLVNGVVVIEGDRDTLHGAGRVLLHDHSAHDQGEAA